MSKEIAKWRKDDIPPKRRPRYKLIITDFEEGFGESGAVLFFHTQFFAKRFVKSYMKYYRNTFKEAVLVDSKSATESS